MDFTILTEESVVAAIMGAVVGAVVVLSGTEYLRHRRELSLARRKLFGEVLILTHDYLALLYETQSSRMGTTDNPVDRCAFGAQFSRMEGRIHDLELRIWQVFPGRLPRAAFRKLCNRLDRMRDLLFSRDVVAAEAFQCAMDWIEEQRVAVGEHFSKAVGFNTLDRARIVFVRFGKVRESDKQALSYEDEPAPWERPPG